MSHSCEIASLDQSLQVVLIWQTLVALVVVVKKVESELFGKGCPVV